jgi:hypothetical protein
MPVAMELTSSGLLLCGFLVDVALFVALKPSFAFRSLSLLLSLLTLRRYSMSVKDQLEQSHIDGSHTTVKSKRSSTSTVMSAFNKEAAWKKEQYGNYEGTVYTHRVSDFPSYSLRLQYSA